MLRSIVAAIALTLSFGSMATAQNYDWRTVLSKAINVQMEINLKYEVSKERRVPIHFTMGIPFSADDLITKTQFPKQNGNLAVAVFLSPDNQLLEYVTVSVGTVNGESKDEQLKRVFSLIETQVYPSVTPPESANVLGGRIAEVAGHPAVEFVSLFDHAEYGPVAVRIVGVIAPNNHDVVFMVQQTMRAPMGLSGPDELSTTFAGTMLSTLTFQAYRDETGKLIKF